MENARIYVGTYKKYNEGSLFGEWINLDQFSSKDEFYEYCQELHKDEEDPEFMFQDWENIPSSFIGESWISEKFWEVYNELDANEFEAFNLFCDHFGINPEEDDVVDNFRSSYQGEYNSEEDYAEQYISDCYNLEKMMGDLHYYFDYERFARDLFMSDLTFIDGHVFNNNF